MLQPFLARPWHRHRTRSGFNPEPPEHFRHAPGLGDAAAGMIRRLGVEDLADRADAGFVQVRLEAGEQLRARPLVRMDAAARRR